MRFIQQKLTLRWQLALLNSGLFAVLCFGLVIFINVLAAATKPSSLTAISAVGFVMVALCGGAGAYFLAGQALQPLREVSVTAAHISAKTLHTRVAYIGAQDELKTLADTFDNMLGRLELAFDQQSRFVADAAHELRTPLATLRTNIEVLTLDEQSSLADYRATVPILERRVNRLERLIADLLVLSKDNQIAHEVVILGALLDDALTELTPLATAQQVTLHLDGDLDASINGDSELFSRVFTNLVENAIRYNRVGGNVSVQVNEHQSVTQVLVCDTGVGISIEAQAHIFERFYRVDQSRARHTGGAGLGLSIVQHILEQHGAAIQVESTPGQGTVFTVSMQRFDATLSTTCCTDYATT